MDLITLRRQCILRNIQLNPIEITVQRTEKVDMDGCFEEQVITLEPYVVRVFQKSSKIPQDVSTLVGTKQVDEMWGLLADNTVDLKAGPNIKDEFNVPVIGQFRIVAVYPQMVQGQLIGVQADLERVS